MVNDVSGNWIIGTSTTFLIRSSQAYAELTVGSVTGSFDIGDVVTGGTSGSIGVVTDYVGGVLTLNYITGEFTDAESITEPGGASATVTSSTYNGDSYGAYVTVTPSYASDEKELLVYHRNHGMDQRCNNVEITGVVSEISPKTNLKPKYKKIPSQKGL